MKLLGYQTGVLYPGFSSAPREALAAVFETHGFRAPARRLRDIDSHRALSSLVTRAGSHRKDGLRILPLEHRAKHHVRAFQIEQILQQGRELAGSVPGARIVSTATGISVTATAAGDMAAPCFRLGAQLKRRAERLLVEADTHAVSRAVNSMAEEARAYRFISKGAHVLAAGDPVTERVVACLRAIREGFYDETTRTGIRASVIELWSHGDNAKAFSDSLLDDAERQVGLLLSRLESDVMLGIVRPETLLKRRRDASLLTASIARQAPVLGDRGKKLEELSAGIASAYLSASDPSEVAIPRALRELSRDVRGVAAEL